MKDEDGGASDGPLAGILVVELGGLGPAPYGAMLLAELGADVVRIDRPRPPDPALRTEPKFDLLNRGKRSLAVDLRHPQGAAVVRRLVARADVVVEGFRPGVAERLGFGPTEVMADNGRLVYARMTGWGREGPLSSAAGHDVNYIALTGALHAIGPRDGPPVIPLNLLGDFGGGGVFLALGIVSALLERTRSGFGQVVDVAMIDGVSSLLTTAHAAAGRGNRIDERGSNMLDGAAPWYNVYETKDGNYVSIGAIEGAFYAEFLRLCGLGNESLPAQHDRAAWPELRLRFIELFKTRTREEWCALLEGSDACFAPVLSLREAGEHAHIRARGTVIEHDGVRQPAPPWRLSRTPARLGAAPPAPGEDSHELLLSLGLTTDDIVSLRASGAVR